MRPRSACLRIFVSRFSVCRALSLIVAIFIAVLSGVPTMSVPLLAAPPQDNTASADATATAADVLPVPVERRYGDKPNILFIAIDDLNDHVGHLQGYPGVKTPHLDRLAARGVAFTNAHCAAPICNPSRVATLFGVRPSTSGIYVNGHQARASSVLKSALTLPQYLRQFHGYRATGAGKIFHSLEWIKGPSDGKNDLPSWDAYWPSMTRQMPQRVMPENTPLGRGEPADRRELPGFMDWGPIGHPEEAMPDYKVVSHTCEKLGQEHTQPFFLACGIFRPHIPFYVPQKYFDLYPLEDIRLPENPVGWLQRLPSSVEKNPTAGAVRRRWHRWIAEHGEWKKAVQAYLASVSFADAQVGRVLDALDASPHKDNTIVVLWSDHGAHLGDKETWEKYTLWHESTRVPLIFSGPGITKSALCRQPASLLDIYPTLLELIDVRSPGTQLEGTSLVPQLQDPDATKAPVVCTHGLGNHAVISANHRLIHYQNGDEELYDIVADPQEWQNIVAAPAVHAVRDELRTALPQVNFQMGRRSGKKRE
ncbi:MAG: sulfatase [Planctomycetaceae bacterium]|nr:sulfatase [Planctomycetaceae bacterium]